MQLAGCSRGETVRCDLPTAVWIKGRCITSQLLVLIRNLLFSTRSAGSDSDETTNQERAWKSPVYDTLANPLKIKVEVESV